MLKSQLTKLALRVVFLIIFCAIFAHADGTPRTTWNGAGPSGAWITVLATTVADGERIYAGTGGGGLFRSDDAGFNWRKANTGLGGRNITSVTVDRCDEDRLFAGTARAGLFASTDGGESWTRVDLALAPDESGFFPWVHAVAICPHDPAVVFVSVGSGLFQSDDGGQSWTRLTSDIMPEVISFDPRSPAVVWAGDLKSTDGGQTWAPPPEEIRGRVHGLLVDPSGNGHIIAVSSTGGVYVSDDDGSTFRSSNEGLSEIVDGVIHVPKIYDLVANETGDRQIFIATGNGVFCSLDQGNHWTPVQRKSVGLLTTAVTVTLSSQPDLLAGTRTHGIERLSMSQRGWDPSNSGLDGLSIFSIAIHPADSRIAFATPSVWSTLAIQEGRGVFRTTNRGHSWTAVNESFEDLRFTALAAAATEPMTLFAGGYNGMVFWSTDLGTTWIPVMTGLADRILRIVVSPSDSQVLHVLAMDGNSRSVDCGRTWTLVFDHFIGSNAFTFDPTNANVVYSGESGVTKSIDGGQTWADITENIPISYPCQHGPCYVSLLAIEVAPEEPNTLYAVTWGRGIWVTHDGGGQWQELPVRIGSGWNIIQSLWLDPSRPGRLVAGTFNTGVWESTSSGRSWTSLKSGMTPSPDILTVTGSNDGTTLYAATSGGVFTMKRSLTWEEGDQPCRQD